MNKDTQAVLHNTYLLSCPECAWKKEMIVPLKVVDVDFDSLNSEGSIDFVCTGSGTKYTTFLILEREEQ